MKQPLGSVKKVNRKETYKSPLSTKLKALKISLKNKIKSNHIVITTVAVIGVIALSIIGYTVIVSVDHSFAATNDPTIEQEVSYDSVSVLGISLQRKSEVYSPTKSSFSSVDKRIFVLDNYFKSRNSPLYGQARFIVEACDHYGAPKDCIVTSAIARHETDLCKYHNSAEYFNCMGWGGGGIYRMSFSSFKEHFDTATDVLVNQYGLRYMDDPRLMEDVFCGPDPECEGWGSRVLSIMHEIDLYAESLGVGRLTDLRSDGRRF